MECGVKENEMSISGRLEDCFGKDSAQQEMNVGEVKEKEDQVIDSILGGFQGADEEKSLGLQEDSSGAKFRVRMLFKMQ